MQIVKSRPSLFERLPTLAWVMANAASANRKKQTGRSRALLGAAHTFTHVELREADGVPIPICAWVMCQVALAARKKNWTRVNLLRDCAEAQIRAELLMREKSYMPERS